MTFFACTVHTPTILPACRFSTFLRYIYRGTHSRLLPFAYYRVVHCPFLPAACCLHLHAVPFTPFVYRDAPLPPTTTRIPTLPPACVTVPLQRTSPPHSPLPAPHHSPHRAPYCRCHTPTHTATSPLHSVLLTTGWFPDWLVPPPHRAGYVATCRPTVLVRFAPPFVTLPFDPQPAVEQTFCRYLGERGFPALPLLPVALILGTRFMVLFCICVLRCS